MKRAPKFIALLTLILIIAFAATVVWLLNDDEFIRAQLEARISESLDRQLTIDHIDIEWGKRTRVRAEHVRLENAAWGQSDPFLSIRSVDGVVDLSRILDGEILIEQLNFQDTSVLLEENAAGDTNWKLETQSEPPSAEERGFWRLDWSRLRISHFELRHESPKREVPLEFEVAKLTAMHSQAGRADLEASGVVGGYSMSISGFIDPLRALVEGGHFTYTFDADLGAIQLESAGSVDDARTFTGARTRVEFSGPEIAWLLEQAALPRFSNGPFDASVTLDVVQDGNLALDVTGDLGSLDVNASGRVDRLFRPEMAELNFDVTGPDLKALGATLGVGQLPEMKYRFEGDVHYADEVLEIDRFEANIGGDTLNISGALGPWPGLEGTHLDVSAQGSDISAWGPAMKFEKWRSHPFSVDAELAEQGDRLDVQDARITVGDSHLELRGMLGSLPALAGSELAINFRTGDVSNIVYIEGLDIPSMPVNASGNLRRQSAGIHLEKVTVSSADNSLVLNGFFTWEVGDVQDEPLSWPQRFAGSRVESRLKLPNALDFAENFDIESVPDLPLAVSVRARIEGGELIFELEDGNLGEVNFELDGRLPVLPSIDDASTHFAITLPSLQGLKTIIGDVEMPDLPLRLTGLTRQTAEGFRFEDVRGRVGKSELALNGTVDRFTSPEKLNLEVQLNIAEPMELESYLREFGEYPLPPDAVTLGFELAYEPGQMHFSDLLAVHGESVLNGDLTYSPGSIPELRGMLEAERLDLTWLTGQADSEAPVDSAGKEEASAASEEVSRVFSDDPLPMLTWNPVHVDLKFGARSIVLRFAELANVNLGLLVSGQSVVLSPLEMASSGGGRLSGEVRFEQSGRQVGARVNGSASGLRFGWTTGKDQASSTYPSWDFDVDLTATGATPHELARTTTGDMRVIVGEGQVLNTRLNLVFSDFLSELFTRLNPFAETSDYTKFECAATVVTFVDGKAKVDPLILQTDKIVATSTGEMNLDTERIDLRFNTRPRRGIGISPGMVINPLIKIGGTMAKPALTIDPQSAAVTGGAAVATGGLSLLGTSLFDRFLRERNPCGKVVAELRRMQQDADAEGPIDHP